MRHTITIDRYLNELAAKSPTPGGGSAAALVGAIGLSLLEMTARYTARKVNAKGLASVLKTLKFAEYSRRSLKKLMDDDEKAYSRLSGARKKGKAKNMASLYKDAAAVPLKACAILQKGIERCERLSRYCKASIATDLAEATLLLEAAFMAAKINVEINLVSIGGAGYTRRVRRSLSKLKASISKAKSRTLRRIGWQLRY